MAVPSPALFHDRPRHLQILSAGVAPAVLGAAAGVLVGVSAAGYWAIGVVAAVGALLSGLEHLGARDGAIRGCVGGLIYGIALLVVHALTGAHAHVSLGSTPVLLAVITAIIGALLAAAGGRIARGQRHDPPRAGPLLGG